MAELRNISKVREPRLVRIPGTRRMLGGFTLIELLVVIAIIGVLAALLLPALIRAKQKAQNIVCLNGIKQWGTSFRMYADDNEGWIPREGFEPFAKVSLQNWACLAAPGSEDVWYNALPPILSLPPISTYWRPPQHKAFFDNKLFIHCAAARWPKTALLPSNRNALFSIAMNSQLIQEGRCDPERSSIQFSLIESQDPSRMVLFLDAMLPGEVPIDPAQEVESLGQSGAWADRFSGRHQRGGQIAFADGHASWLPGTKVVECNPESPLRGGPILPPKDVVWEIY